MSVTKRIWLERDPAYKGVHRRYIEETSRHISEFEFRAPLRRRSRRAGGPHWDPLWMRSLERAVKTLGFEVVRVNEGMFFRTREERDTAVALAEEGWREGRWTPERTEPQTGGRL